MGRQVGSSLPAHLGSAETVHVCGTLYTTGGQKLSLPGQAASPVGAEKSRVSPQEPEGLLLGREVPAPRSVCPRRVPGAPGVGSTLRWEGSGPGMTKPGCLELREPVAVFPWLWPAADKRFLV